MYYQKKVEFTRWGAPNPSNNLDDPGAGHRVADRADLDSHLGFSSFCTPESGAPRVTVRVGYKLPNAS